MATKTETIVTVESDLSGEAEASTLTFAIEDTEYEIDLTEVEQADFKELFAKYIAAGRPYTPRAVPQMTPAEREEIRAWLLANDIEVAHFGRLPMRALKAWNEAHPERQYGL
ncbi:MAG: Lsr2 dimerization domain-containing protein [Gammaproteobacteria bacterium]